MRIKAFLDTNVLLDLLMEDRHSAAASSKVLESVVSHRAEGVIATQSFIDAAYIYLKSKPQEHQKFINFVLFLSNRFNIHSVDSFAIYDACNSFKGDFEDDALFSVARATCCDVFITSDKSFISRYTGADPHILVMTPEEYIERATA